MPKLAWFLLFIICGLIFYAILYLISKLNSFFLKHQKSTEDNLNDIYSKWSVKDLAKAVNKDKSEYTEEALKAIQEELNNRGPIYNLKGLNEILKGLEDKLLKLPLEKYEDLSPTFKSRPFKNLYSIGEAINFIPNKLEQIANNINRKLYGIKSLRTGFSTTMIPVLSIPIWREFHGGSTDGINNIVLRTGENSFVFIWTP